MSYSPTKWVQRAWSCPPRCLAGLEVESLKEWPFERVIDEMALFHLRCSCGSASLHVLGYTNDLAAGYLLDPLSVQCLVCERVVPLFDSREHGYDGEYGHGGHYGRGSGEPRKLECRQCSGVAFATYVAFSYELEDDDAAELDAEHPGRIQDFFDWFTLNVRCEHCGTLSTAADYECA